MIIFTNYSKKLLERKIEALITIKVKKIS